VLSRINPREVRYCRCDPKTRISTIKKLMMPSGLDEEAKFVRGAVLAYPELYFARFVLLVEGDSERIVLPRLAEALDLLIDPAFVAIVPLGGRHVQHFWRLLSHLGIPHATLLDLDLGREGGGFGRVKTAIQKLIDVGAPKAKLLALSNGSQLSDAYAATIPKGGGPKMAVDKAAEAVLGTAGPGLTLYGGAFKAYPDLLPAYRYHFLTHSKPATHLAALTHIKTKALRDDMPPILAELLKHIAGNLRHH